MSFLYKSYNVPIISKVALPGLMIIEKASIGSTEPVYVELGSVPEKLQSTPTEIRVNCTLNENEYLLKVPNIANYYVTDGKRILIEPISENFTIVLMYFYSSCLALALLQRNIITFHVAGVIVNNKVVLLAADSGIGKSTTAVKLQELGYPIFTDDTAILEVENDLCYATASYPISRLWQKTIENQKIYDERSKEIISEEIEKYSFSFHKQFVTTKMQVASILFLEKREHEIIINPLQPHECLKYLLKNVYVSNSIIATKKQRLQFEKTSAISKVLPAYVAQRPINISSLETFASVIAQKVLAK
jgi:hypothetical protein